jgi:hypothetical protein
MYKKKTKSNGHDIQRIKCECSNFLGEYKEGRFHPFCKRCKQIKDVQRMGNRRNIGKNYR